MIVHTNRTALINRLITNGAKRQLDPISTTLSVYFNSIQEEAVPGIDSRGDFKIARVMTNPGADLRIGDQLTIQGQKWKVNSGEVHSDLTGGHESYLVTSSL